MIKEAISIVVSGQSLSQESATQVMLEIMEGDATAAQIAALGTALRIKGESVDEITGMATAMRLQSLKVDVSESLVDTCGTGGDNLGTFNISTAAAIVAAASGIKIAKHGNRAMSGSCGSADILEAAGVKIDLSPSGVAQCITEVGMGFMFAQRFHPAMRHASGPRREIGIRTIFNLLGPLTNPAAADAQVLGIADKAFGIRMAQSLIRLGIRRGLVVHGADGIDEVSLSGPTTVWEINGDSVDTYTLNPEEFGLNQADITSISGGTPSENAGLLVRVLQGEEQPLSAAISLNAGAAIFVGGLAPDMHIGVSLATEVLRSGAGLSVLKQLSTLSQQLD